MNLNFKHTHYQPALVYRSKITSPFPKNIIKMSSAMPFFFNAVDLCIVVINGKSWTRAKEVCRALEYKNCRARDVLKKHVSIEKKQHKHELKGRATVAHP